MWGKSVFSNNAVDFVLFTDFADFRPAWADIFPEYVDGYDYWGYCDLDNPYLTAKDLPDCFVITPNRICARDKMAIDETKKLLTGQLFSSFRKVQYFLHYYFKKITTNRYGIRGMLRRKQHAKDSQAYIQALRQELG